MNPDSLVLPDAAEQAAPASASTYGLRHNALSPLEVLAQSFAAIAPSTIPLFAVPLVFSLAGNGAWLAFLIALIAMVLVACCIAVFARDSASPGSLYVYVRNTLPPAFAVAVAWGLLFAYVTTASAVSAAAMTFAERWKLPIPSAIVPIIIALTAFAVVYREVKISAQIMLWVEAVSVTLISIIVAITLWHRGLHLDPLQLHLTGTNASNIRLGFMVAIFGFVGFESATSLGSEARDPLRTIPRSVLRSALAAGIFYVLCTYAETAAFHGLPTTLADSTAPFHILATQAGVPVFGILIDAGVLVSLLSCVIACIIAAARVLMLMAHHGLLPTRLTRTHTKHDTPVGAALLTVVAIATPLVALSLHGASGSDLYGWLGTLSVFGFLTAYGLVCIAMPVHLHQRGHLRFGHLALAIGATLITLAAAFGTVYPLPPAPYRYLPWIYVAYLALGMTAYFLLHRPKPTRT